MRLNPGIIGTLRSQLQGRPPSQLQDNFSTVSQIHCIQMPEANLEALQHK